MKQELLDAEADFKKFEAMYRETSLSRSEKISLNQIDQDFAAAVRLGNQILQDTDRLNQFLEEFAKNLEEIDALLDDQIQPLIHAETIKAAEDAKFLAGLTIKILLLFSVIAIVIGSVLAWLLVESIVNPILELVRGTEIIGQGDLEHRIDTDTQDEFNLLGNSFNQMTSDLKQSIAYAADIIKSMSDSLMVVTPEGTIQTVNEAACAMLGYPKNDLIGKKIGNFFAEEEALSLHFYHIFYKNLIQKGVVSNLEKTCFSKNGRKIPVLLSSSIMRDGEGNIQGVVCVIKDITQGMKIHEELKRSEEKFRSYFELPLIGVAIFDTEQRWIELNDRMCEIIGYSREELMGFVWTDVVHPEDISHCLNFIEEIKNNQGDQYTTQKRYIGKNGKITFVEACVGCVRNINGDPEFYVAVVQDISLRKKHEADLEKHRNHLEELVEKRNINLLEVNEGMRHLYRRLEKVRESERKHIAREIHDELGQRLSYLQFDLQLMQVEIPGIYKVAHEKMFKWKETINETIEIIRMLSESLRPPLLDIMGLSEAIKEQCQGVEKRTKIICNFHSSPNDIKIDPELSVDVYRIVQEAITNSVRHSNPNSISVGLFMEKDAIRLEIADDGRGIEEDEIFSIKSLGLIGMRERAHAWGGSIQIKNIFEGIYGSKPARGTQLNLYIPLTKSLIK